MITVGYIFTYIFEQFISLMYFNSTFEQKRKKPVIFACFVASFAVQYISKVFEDKSWMLLSTIVFFVCNLAVLLFCYKTKLFKALFHVFLLEGLMMTTELAVLYLVSSLFDVDLLEFNNNATLMFIDVAATKTLYFFTVMLVAKIRERNKDKSDAKNFAYVLLILPFISSVMMVLFGKIMIETKVTSGTYMLFAATTILLLVANLMVFFIHEKVVSTLTKNTELQLEMQKAEISEDYYKELEYQYNLSHILVHDIKRQLTIIKDIAEGEQDKNTCEYIASVYDGYEIRSLKRYSSNKLLNIILTRYAHACNDNGIEFFADIKSVDLSFIADSDLTAIIDNLLENALESAEKSSNKNVTIEIDKKNEQFLFIKISNSCDREPQLIDELMKSEKKDSKHHGYGLRSVRRAAKKYNGEIDFNYDSAAKVFNVIVMFGMD